MLNMIILKEKLEDSIDALNENAEKIIFILQIMDGFIILY